MATTIIRKPASFRFRTDLMERLRSNAAKENRTLNNYVESVLLEYIFNEPNETTKAATVNCSSSPYLHVLQTLPQANLKFT